MLEIYNLSGARLARLKDAYDVGVEYELGSWPTLTFSLPITSANWQYVIDEHRVKLDSEWFVIKTAGVSRGDDVPKQQVTCPSIASDLNFKYNQVLDITGLPTVVMDAILAGSGWTRGNVAGSFVAKSRTFQGDWQSVTANLKDVAEKFKGYLDFHSSTKTVDLLDSEGTDTGVVIKYGKNLKSIEKTSESLEFVTRLYPIGADDMTIVTANPTGKLYIENYSYFLELGYTQAQIDADIASYGEASVFVRVGYLPMSDYIEAQALYEDAKRKLDEELCKPKVSYKVDALNLADIGFSSEDFHLGDVVTVKDTELGVNITARITKMTVYPGFPEKTSIEISNAKDNFYELLADAMAISANLGQNSQISNLTRGIINTFATTINSANGKLYWDDGVLEAIDLSDPNKRVRLTAGGVGVTKDGGQTYANAITGDGILANSIVVTDQINLFSGDKKTRVTGTGIEVYDNSATPVKKIHLGNYSTGKYGLWINAGAIEIMGTFDEASIPQISAGKIEGGIINATQKIYVGSKKSVVIDAFANQIRIQDNQATPVTRVILGEIAGDYGIDINDPNGALSFSTFNKTLKIGTGGKIVIGNSESDFKLKFDGTDLVIGDGVLTWNNLAQDARDKLSSYSIALTNPQIVIPTDADGSNPVLTYATCEVYLYKGESLLNPTVGTLVMSGCTATKTVDAANKKVTINITGVSASNGYVSVPVSDGATVVGTRTIYFAKSTKGLQGPAGPSGPPGSDASVPAWVVDWTSGMTQVAGHYIATANFFAGTGGQLATGTKIDSNGIVNYVSNQKQGFEVDPDDGKIKINWAGVEVAHMDYDTNGAGTANEAANRVFIRSLGSNALKLQAGGNMSIEALGGKVYIATATTIAGDLTVTGNINATGLTAVAVFG